MEKKFLILAHPRSGTLYTGECLRAIGLDVGHEVPGRDGAVSFVWGGPGEPELDYEDPPVILHQVRHPLKVIGSMHGEPLRMWHQLMYQIQGSLFSAYPRAIPSTSLIGPEHENETVWAALTWLRLNQCIAGETPLFVYRIEHFQAVWPRILTAIGVDSAPFPLNIPTNINTRREQKPVITWEMLRRGLPESLYYDLQYAAEVYGYSTDSEAAV